ncbi:MAG: DNA mismatch repair endonuclease MutL [Bacteroidales bacterium]|nr:DNA mismatch repair endonuclease MutL [Bacteroidales bacterium]
MNDIIHLLPDAVANQIAAGEVVQRPASAVKELLENAVDAGARHIQLIIKDAGRTLIQVVDDGKGMSFNDARLCFERHATSKISCADDLFAIRTKGFRGEALASIAAIAQVELKTRRPEDETATRVVIEGSEIKEHGLTVAPEGTSIAVNNLFFNVPARRNFLKSDATEFANIEEEFNRVVLVHPDIAFTLYHNGKMVLQLPAGNLKQRITGVFGTAFNDRIFPIEQETNFMKIGGFLGKPEHAKKKRSEQYLFINHRFVKSSSLNFAIENAYTQLVPEGHHPPYFIYIEVNPATVDVNISPTKVEVKLQDDRLVFGFLNAAVKKAIGEFSLVPQLDFDYDKDLDPDNVPTGMPIKPPTVALDPSYNPFHSSGTSHHNSSGSGYSAPKRPSGMSQDWDSFLRDIHTTEVTPAPTSQPVQMQIVEEGTSDDPITAEAFLPIYKKYLIVRIKGQLMVIDLYRANERIIYESYITALKETPVVVQQSLFPETITLTAAQSELLNELKNEFKQLGYEIEPMSSTNFAINGTPVNEEIGDIQTLIEGIIDDYKSNRMNRMMETEKNLALCMARQRRSSLKPIVTLQEVNSFLQQLFSCLMPTISPSGKKIYEMAGEDYLQNLLK